MQCNCRRTKAQIKCGTELECDRKCEKNLTCGNHVCDKKCHRDDCTPCTKVAPVRCKCGKVERDMPCGETDAWSCDQICSKLKNCSNHECDRICHVGPCDPCALVPSAVSTCNCGKENIDPASRSSCLDEIPSCSATCGKTLSCGHLCNVTCHSDACPECDLKGKFQIENFKKSKRNLGQKL